MCCLATFSGVCLRMGRSAFQRHPRAPLPVLAVGVAVCTVCGWCLFYLIYNKLFLTAFFSLFFFLLQNALPDITAVRINLALKKAVAAGKLVQVKESYKLPATRKEAAAAPAKKAAPKKKATKKAAPKKKATKKKAAAPKKKATKKKATKKKK